MILESRLVNQHLARQPLSDPTQLVAHLGAVQAQDYAAARWALGLRLRDATEQSVEDAFNAGSILRTHVLRPTWHLVAPADIRWMLALTAPRVKAAAASYTRAAGLDAGLVARCEAAIARALEGGEAFTRAELGAALQQAGIEIEDGGRLSFVMLLAELDALVCSGPRRGKQHTYMLLEARVPRASALDADEALAELTWRYFSSHGPALVHDCSWWSGLAIAQINRGLELNSHRLQHEAVEGRMYWYRNTPGPALPLTAHLLPNFDEYTVAYRERDLFYDRARNDTGDPRRDVPFTNVIVLRGQVVGRWARTARKEALGIEARWSIRPSDDECGALQAAAERYAGFVGGQPEIVDG
jgi:hypothetical protein